MPSSIQCLLANNPSPMTYEGTNCYLLETESARVLIDAGPEGDTAHVSAVLQALGGKRLDAILLTHGHRDHAGGAAALRAATGAPLMGFSPFIMANLTLDRSLADGERLFGLEAIHTPGHASDHLCYALPQGTVFTGDHVMGWSSSFIPKDHGSLSAYLLSLQKMIDRNFTRFLPGHGGPIEAPNPVMQGAITTRLRREAQIAACLTAAPQSLPQLALCAYGSRAEGPLREAILQTVNAHLIKLAEDGRATQSAAGWNAV